jgi:hypothetical protein
MNFFRGSEKVNRVFFYYICRALLFEYFTPILELCLGMGYCVLRHGR